MLSMTGHPMGRPASRPQANLFQLVQEAEQLHDRLLWRRDQPGKLGRIIARSRARYLRRVQRLQDSPLWQRMAQHRETARRHASLH
jgi:hypothetical protein